MNFLLKHTAYTLDTVETAYTVYDIETAFHCLNFSTYAYIYIQKGKVKTLLEWADVSCGKKSD